MDPTPYALAKQLEGEMLVILSNIDTATLEAKVTRMVSSLKRTVIDLRLDVRDYEYAETKHEQQKRKAECTKRTVMLQKDILAASEYNIFSSIDVAQLSMLIDRIQERLD